MRRSSGVVLGTMAVFAVLLVALSIAAGAFSLAVPSAVRTDGGPAAHVSAAHLAAPTAVVPAATSAAAHPMTAASSIQALTGAIAPPAAPRGAPGGTVLTGVTVSPPNSTIAVSTSMLFAATPWCTVGVATNQSCPASTTFGWTNLNPSLGWLNATNGSVIRYYANATLGWANVTATAYFNGTAMTSALTNILIVNPVNVTLTNVTLAPASISLAPGQVSGPLVATPLCTVNNVTNQTCPQATLVSWSGPNGLGTLAAPTGLVNFFQANWAALGTEAIGATASYNNTNLSVGKEGVITVAQVAPIGVTVFASGAPAITVKYTSAFSLYMPLPFTVNWTVTVGNGSINGSNTQVFLNVRDIAGNCGSLFGLGGPCATVVNLSEPVASGQSSFSQTLNYSILNSSAYAAPTAGVFPSDNYQLLVWVTDNNTHARVTAAVQQNVYTVFQTPLASFVAPVPGDSLSTGNVTFAVKYAGYYIQAAAVTVTNSGGHVVYVQPMFAPGLTNRTVAATTAWAAVTPGTYTATLNLSTPYGTTLITQSYTVLAAGQTIYVNHTYVNKSELPGGLSPGVAGALLLTVGLIVGLIVALVLGRMMWGTPSQPTSPQPWSPTSGSGGSGDMGSGGSSSGGSGGSDSSSGGSGGSSGSGGTDGKT